MTKSNEGKPKFTLTTEMIERAGRKSNEEQRKIFYKHQDPYEAMVNQMKDNASLPSFPVKDYDPYEAQGSSLRVNHPVQPKTQVDRWREEIEENWREIYKVEHPRGYFVNCQILLWTEKSRERFAKIQELEGKIAKATKPIHPRYATGEFGDDKPSVFVTEKERTLLDKIKKLLCLK